MAGYIQPLLRTFAAAPRQPGAGEQSAIERLSFELFGDLDGDGGSGVPRERQAPSRHGEATPAKPNHSAPFSQPAFNSFAALAAYDASLRRPERATAEPRAPAELGDLVRGRAVYARTAGADRSDRSESAGLVVNYRF